VALFAILTFIVPQVVRHPPTFHAWPMWISGGVWIAFVTYWSAAAKNSAQVRKSESKESRAIHESLINLALLLLFISIPGLRLRFEPDSREWEIAGLAIQVAFLALAVWARRHLDRNWSGEITIKIDHQLIRSGPYGRIRHPIYTAMLGMYAGTAVVSGEIHALIAVAMVAFAYFRKIRMEESNLHEAFGPEYSAYKRRTWALVPLVF
jgi:protein-S-isoprenylcysteine O-methyltransferase Ste14